MTPIWGLIWLFGSFILLCVGAFMIASWAGLFIAIGAWEVLEWQQKPLQKQFRANKDDVLF